MALSNGERTIQDLEVMMYELWDSFFSDVPRKNLVLIHFGKYSARRLGSIKWATKRSKIKYLMKDKEEELKFQDDPRVSIITITRFFASLSVPELIPRMTIAHEMVHYAHGFHSPLPQLYDNPHRGNIVNKELIKRGMGSQLAEAEEWLKQNWAIHIRMKK